MHPYSYSHWHYRPSRFIWFAIGVAAATLWMKRDHVRDQTGYCYRRAIRTDDPHMTSVPQRMPLLSPQAEEKVTELSETTLNSIISTVEALKVKLAEHKAERRKQEEGRQASNVV